MEQDGENLLGQGSDGPKLPARSVGPANAVQGGRLRLGLYSLPKHSTGFYWCIPATVSNRNFDVRRGIVSIHCKFVIRCSTVDIFYKLIFL